MAYTTPRTWVTGELVTAAFMNANVRDNVSFLANPPTCLVYHNATQSIANNTFTPAAFNSETNDTDTMHDTVTNNTRITFKTAGIYIITFNCAWPTNGVGERQVNFFLNNTADIAGDSKASAGVTGDVRHSVTHKDKFAVNDYIEARVFQNSGGALVLQVNPRFTATWIGLG